MPMFLVEGSYTADGLKGLAKESASGRETAVKNALAALGGRLVGIYYALGDADVYVLCECPDHVAVAALSLAASSSGLIRTKTVALMTVEETNRAIAMKTGYRAPGAAKKATA